MLLRQKHRMYFNLYAAFCQPRHADQLDHIAKFLRIADILRRDVCNAFGIHLGKGHVGVKRDGCHNRHLASCIVAFHIRSRIALCIAELCRKGKCLFVAHPILRHPRQDIVGRPVDNAHHFCQFAGCQTLAQRTDDWNRACNRRFKMQVTFSGFRCIEQLFSIFREQILIRRYNLFACAERFLQPGQRRPNSSHHLNHDFDLGIV